uniref:Uncharacterized protein n=1 Tax=Anopheles coluzzii TaxID=1518534 RepID=A0A8W7PUM4_ANOCL
LAYWQNGKMDLLSSILGSMDRPPSKQQKGTNMYENELNARKNGEVWNEETAAQYAEKRRLKHLKQSGDTSDLHITRAEKLTPVSSCTKKYMQLFSEEVKMENVRKTEINASYGYGKSILYSNFRS